jgi:SAM-dependent methyltransferase
VQDDRVTQARLVLDGYLAHMPGRMVLPGTRVLELDPGAWLGTAVLLACRRARVTVADRYLVPWSDPFHVPFFQALLEDVTGRPGEDPAPIRRLLEARAFVPDVIARIAAGAERLPCPDAAFDVVLSSHVFEHLEHVPCALSNLARITARSGFGVHQVHFGDRRDRDRQLEHLTLDNDVFWSMFELSQRECGNRWRYTDFSASLTQAGFDVLQVDPAITAPDGYLRDVRRRLHPDFVSRSDDELRTLSAWMVCRRAEREPQAAMTTRPGLLPAGMGDADAYGRRPAAVAAA